MSRTFRLVVMLALFVAVSVAAHAGPSVIQARKPTADAWGYQAYDDIWQALKRGWKYLSGGDSRWSAGADRAGCKRVGK